MRRFYGQFSRIAEGNGLVWPWGSTAVGVRGWATRKLRSGDLTALAAIALGRPPSQPGPAERLIDRGFARERDDASLAVTISGRLALLVRRFLIW